MGFTTTQGGRVIELMSAYRLFDRDYRHKADVVGGVDGLWYFFYKQGAIDLTFTKLHRALRHASTLGLEP